MKNHIAASARLLLPSILLFIALLLPSCGETGKVILENCVDITFSEPAYNGYAIPSLSVDENKLNASVKPELMQKFHEKNPLILLGSGDSLSDLLDFSFEKDYSRLSNGDIVRINVKPVSDLELCGISTLEQLERELHIQFSADTFNVKINGLKDPVAQVIDLNQLIHVDFGKYDGYSTPTLTVDQDYLASLVNRDVFKEYLASASPKEADALKVYNYTSLFDITFPESYNKISNGDQIRVTISPNANLLALGFTMQDLENALLIKFETTDVKYTVSGLEKAENVIDLFDGIEEYLTFRGPNGKGSVSLKLTEDYNFSVGDIFFNVDTIWYSNSNRMEIIYDNTSIGSVYYRLDLEKGRLLDQGEIITIQADIDPTFFDKHGYILASTTHDITVPDMGEYLTEGDIQSDETIDRLITHLIEKAKSNAYRIIACHELYFGTINPGVKNEYNSKNTLVGVVETFDGWWGTRYELVYLYDVVLAPNGTIFSSCDSDLRTNTIEEAKERLRTDYTFAKIR